MPKLAEQEISARLEAGKSPRYKRIERLQKYFDGSIYDGRPAWLDRTVDVPLLERAPCIRYPIVEATAKSYSALCLGDGKFPTFTSNTSEDDRKLDPDFGLSDVDSKTFDAVTKKIVEQARLPAVSQQAFERALYSSSCGAVVSLVRGKFKITLLDPKTCTPTWLVSNPDELASVEISYRYVEDRFDAGLGVWTKAVMVYRRVIDAKTDTTFVPVEVVSTKDFPKPSEPDPAKTVSHGLGFVPVVWYAFLAAACDATTVDGVAFHASVLEQIDAINYALSSRHQAALYAGDPQLWETGVDTAANVGSQGRVAGTPLGPDGKPAKPDGWQDALYPKGRASGARKKGPGQVWQYENPDAKVGMLTMPGDALKGPNDHIADLRAKICEALGAVFIDPATLRGTADISGKALAVIYANQIARCNQYREDFGRGFLLKTLSVMLRIVAKTPSGIYVAGVDKLRKLLGRFATDQGWFDPSIQLKWGDYFEPSDVDEETRVDVALKALGQGIITDESALQKIKPIFNIDNTAQYLETLKQERAEKQANAAALAQASKPAAGDKPLDGAAKPKKPATKTQS